MQQGLCVYLGEQLADYHFGAEHPFGPMRYGAFYSEFQRRALAQRVTVCAPARAGEEDLALFHERAYIERVQAQSQSGTGFLDYGDTPARPGIYEAASWVVGTVLQAVEAIMLGACARAFVPIAGLHHARADTAAGFCVFNDCAVAIEALRRRHGLTRLAYVDIDAHHGDGVYYAFEADPRLCIVDFHEDGRYLYPGSGFAAERGSGAAAGSKLNLPLPPGCDDEQALALWPEAEAFIRQAQPQFILLQCGADSLAGDPLTDLRLSPSFHAHVARRLCSLAAELGHGRLLALGGGGYELENIAQAWNGVIEAMLPSES